jgi:hypothetical protein
MVQDTGGVVWRRMGRIARYAPAKDQPKHTF